MQVLRGLGHVVECCHLSKMTYNCALCSSACDRACGEKVNSGAFLWVPLLCWLLGSTHPYTQLFSSLVYQTNMSDGSTERHHRGNCYDTIKNRRMLHEHHSPIDLHLSLRDSTWDQIKIWMSSVYSSLIPGTVWVDTVRNQGESKLWDLLLRIDLI